MISLAHAEKDCKICPLLNEISHWTAASRQMDFETNGLLRGSLTNAPGFTVILKFDMGVAEVHNPGT